MVVYLMYEATAAKGEEVLPNTSEFGHTVVHTVFDMLNTARDKGMLSPYHDKDTDSDAVVIYLSVDAHGKVLEWEHPDTIPLEHTKQSAEPVAEEVDPTPISE